MKVYFKDSVRFGLIKRLGVLAVLIFVLGYFMYPGYMTEEIVFLIPVYSISVIVFAAYICLPVVFTYKRKLIFRQFLRFSVYELVGVRNIEVRGDSLWVALDGEQRFGVAVNGLDPKDIDNLVSWVKDKC